MDKHVKRAELHGHTCMTMRGGVSSAVNLVRAAHQQGMTAVAITDHGSLQSFPYAYWEWKNIHKTDDSFKVIYGVEINIINDDQQTYPMTILVRDQIGVKNLYKLMSKYLTGDNAEPGIMKADLEKCREGLLYGSYGIQGEVAMAIINGLPDSDIRETADFYDYIEILPKNDSDLHAIGKNSSQEPQEIEDKNKSVFHVADALNKPVIASANVYFTNDTEETAHRIIRYLFEDDQRKENLQNYLMDTDALLEEFSYLGEDEAHKVVVENTAMIADSIDFIVPIKTEKHYPIFPEASKLIEEKCLKRVHDIYGESCPEIVNKQLAWELSKIKENEYGTLYLIAYEVVKKSKDNGFTVGSRGCMAASFVCYLMGITDINPLPPHYLCTGCRESDFNVEYGEAFHMGDVGIDLPDRICPHCGRKMKKDGFDIPVETILGLEGEKEPDFDLNYAPEVRDKAIEAINEMSCVEQTLACGCASSMSWTEAKERVKEYVTRESVGIGSKDVENLVQTLCNIKTSDVIHPGGVFIIPKGMETEDFTPKQLIQGRTTTHLHVYSLSDSLLKVDILSHTTPSILKNIKDETGVDPSEIPLYDRRVMSLLSSVDEFGINPDQIGGVSVGTIGVPSLGSNKVIREMLPKLNITSFSDLIRLAGFDHGTGAWEGNAEQLIASGKVSIKECIAHREDIMLYLMSTGMDRKEAFTIMESVRKGRWAQKEEGHLIEQMRSHGVPEWYIESCAKIQYLFPKAHSVGYILNAWRLLYYKLYYPEAFYRAALSCSTSVVYTGFAKKGYDHARTEYERSISHLKEYPHAYECERRAEKCLMVMEMYARGIGIL